MKKQTLRALMLLAVIVMTAFAVKAQMPQIPQLPIDSAVRVGKLDNGMTYYIRHNETPKGQADFFIAQKVGSILENDNQRGLAHFLEHMCFNGTENFPGNSLIDWLETVGVKFGVNLNAYTSIDETVYNISKVPVSRTGVQDSCLLILHDWADGLLLDPEEINKERGVIHEEWRRSMEGQMRILEAQLPTMFPGSKYGYRLPIGTMEVVDNFPPQAIRDYYETWYRPDQQGIIVVGDIDPDYIEAKIKEIFSPIKMPENAQPRVYEQVSDTPGTIFAIGKDKEQKMPIVLFFIKQPQKLVPEAMRNTAQFLTINYMTSVIESMLNSRLDEIAKKPDSPFANAGISIDDYFIASTKDALMMQVVAKGNAVEPAFEAAYAELLRAAKGGFTPGEYERAKAEYIANLEKAYGQRNATENTRYAREYAANFTKGDPIPGIETEYEMANMLSQFVTIDQINQVFGMLFAQGADNRVVLAMLPDTEAFNIPTEESLAKVLANVEAQDLEPYRDAAKTEPLIPNLPEAVKATETTTDAALGTTTLKYANGLTVVVKPTAYKENEIIVEGIAKGGFSALPEDDAYSIQFMPYAMMNHGLGDYTNLDLQKYMQGKQSSLNIDIDKYYTALSGSTTPKDIKTLMELLYMNFTAITITEEEFAASQARISGILANQEANPQYIFGKDLYESLYKAVACQQLSVANIAKADRQTTLDIIHRMMAHPGRFTLVFVGDIKMDEFTALADQYLGTLRADRSMPVPYITNPAFEPALGEATTVMTTKMETPQVWTAITMGESKPYTAKERVVTSIAGQVLSKRLLNKVREEMGATYSIGASANMSRVGNENIFVMIPFPMSPDKKDEVLAAIRDILNNMTTDVKAEEVDPIKEYMVKTANEDLEKNDKWADALSAETLNGVQTFTNAVETINTVTAADICTFMKELLAAGNLRTFLLEPEK